MRQHDLRSHHACTRGSCPAPLVDVAFELSTIALSPLTSYQFVVAGESPYVSRTSLLPKGPMLTTMMHMQGYLFDRRQAGRYLQQEWGIPPEHDGVVTCVRRFGRPNFNPAKRTGREHITGARMATSNGDEVLLCERIMMLSSDCADEFEFSV